MPDKLPPPDFTVVRRGYRRSQVDRYLRDIRVRLEAVEADRTHLREQLVELGLDDAGDLQGELERVAADVGQVLQAAREAAEGMRVRASDDAAQWVEEAKVEVRMMQESAQGDAVALRRDAWNSGSELLLQAQATGARLVREAEEEALMIQAQAEQEAARLTSSARRESEEERRSARFEAERLVTVANAEAQALVEAAQRESDAVQERVSALERRRSELHAELDATRLALSQVEADIENRRRGREVPTGEGLQSVVRVMPAAGDVAEPPAPEETREWQADTIRLVSGSDEPQPEPIDPAALAAEVEALQAEAARDAVPASTAEDEPAAARPDEPEADAVEPVAEADEPTADGDAESAVGGVEIPAAATDVAGLFAALRGQATGGEPNGDRASAPAAVDPPGVGVATVDPLELRDRLVLPVVNSALRGFKQALVEVQNAALDGLRTEGGAWRPNRRELAAALAEEAGELAGSAFRGGLAAVAELTGENAVDAGGDSPDDPTDRVAGALAGEITAAIEQSAASGPRATNAAVSRVIRLWRAEHAERHLRMAATSAYHQGMAAAAAAAGLGLEGVAAGPMCAECPAGVRWKPPQAPPPGVVLPPAHATCGCTVAPRR